MMWATMVSYLKEMIISVEVALENLLQYAYRLGPFTSAPANWDASDFSRPWHFPFPDENTMSVGWLRGMTITTGQQINGGGGGELTPPQSQGGN